MTRLLLTCIGVAALQLGAPRPGGVAELLGPGGERTSVVPRPEAPAKGSLTRDGSRTDDLRGAQVTPGAPAEPPQPPLASAHGTSPTEASRHSGPVSIPRVLPDARAPPA